MFAQHPDHQRRGFLCPRIGEGMLPGGQILVPTNPGADECGRQHRIALGIHHAESDGFKKRTSVFNSARRNSVKAPFVAAKLVEIDVGHKCSY
jgi:hypothetical protein